jgi:hypothetical protein
VLKSSEKDIDQIFADGTLIDLALMRAAAEVVRLHKEKGVPLVIYRDGKTVLVPAEELEEPGAAEPQRRVSGQSSAGSGHELPLRRYPTLLQMPAHPRP